MMDRWLIRKIGDLYYLVDTDYNSKKYTQPIEINEVGADICEGLIRGDDPVKITKYIAAKYEATEDEVRGDVEEFIENINRTIMR